MVIAVNAGVSSKDRNNEYRNFIAKCFAQIIGKHTSHKFIFISDEQFTPSFSFAKNSTRVVIFYKWVDSLFENLGLKKKISSILKKKEVGLFITNEGLSISDRDIQQCIIIRSSDKVNQLGKKNLNQAKSICVDSEFLKREIIEQYKVDANKICTVHDGIDDVFQPVNYSEKEIIKDKYAEGKEYFLCTNSKSSRENFVSLLKAFSLFKKRQKSTMQLLFAGETLLNEGLSESLLSYKYKDEVKILDITSVDEFVKIIASAYAVVSPFYSEEIYLPVLQIMKCEVPVLSNSNGVFPEVGSDAVLYVNQKDYSDIADKMMLIFKDEELRQQLIQKGKDNAMKYSWERSSDLFWNAILSAKKAT